MRILYFLTGLILPLCATALLERFGFSIHFAIAGAIIFLVTVAHLRNDGVALALGFIISQPTTPGFTSIFSTILITLPILLALVTPVVPEQYRWWVTVSSFSLFTITLQFQLLGPVSLFSVLGVIPMVFWYVFLIRYQRASILHYVA